MYFQNVMAGDERFYLQKERGESSWFGFALILRQADTAKRDRIVAHLRANGIETRPIVAGNFARQPVFNKINASIGGTLENADHIHENGFFVGNHSHEMHKEIDYLRTILSQVD